MKKTLILRNLVATVATALLVGTAQADTLGETLVQSSLEQRSEPVSYADLNLASAEARETLYWRLYGAARKVCGSSDVRITGDLAQATQNRSCFDDALARALDDVPSAQVASAD